MYISVWVWQDFIIYQALTLTWHFIDACHESWQLANSNEFMGGDIQQGPPNWGHCSDFNPLTPAFFSFLFLAFPHKLFYAQTEYA